MIIDSEYWDQMVKMNTDPYGGACVTVAKRRMEILDEDTTPLRPGGINDAHTPRWIINKAQLETNIRGITGYMAGAIAAMISRAHSRGEEFRKIWNGEYEFDDAKGVVNPAILTLSKEK